MKKDLIKTAECKVCMVAHDDEIHSATLSVRHWFAWQVTKHFEDSAAAAPPVPAVVPAAETDVTTSAA